MMGPVVLDVLISGVAIGGFAILGVALALSPQPGAARWVGAVFFLAAIAAAVDGCPPLRVAEGPLNPIARTLSCAAPGMFWAFALTLFGDAPRVPAWLWAPPALGLALGVAGAVGPAWSLTAAWPLLSLVSILLVAHALVVIWRGWRGDLVESRRRLRAPVMAAAGAYVFVLSLRDMSGSLGLAFLNAPLLDALILAALAMGGVVSLLRLDPILLGAGAQAMARGPQASAILDVADQALLARLELAMEKDEVWRREDLSIGALAEHVGAPEHRLRRLINGALGHRNFATFINARRIEAAKRALCDPARMRASVSTIAYDLGFGSLGPFNRAFKDQTGMTPTAWRQAGSAEGSPKPENPASNR